MSTEAVGNNNVGHLWPENASIHKIYRKARQRTLEKLA